MRFEHPSLFTALRRLTTRSNHQKNVANPKKVTEGGGHCESEMFRRCWLSQIAWYQERKLYKYLRSSKAYVRLPMQVCGKKKTFELDISEKLKIISPDEGPMIEPSTRLPRPRDCAGLRGGEALLPELTNG